MRRQHWNANICPGGTACAADDGLRTRQQRRDCCSLSRCSLNHNTQRAVVNIRGHVQTADVCRGHRFKPDSLPDAGRPGVEDATVAVGIALLAHRRVDAIGLQRGVDANDDLIRAAIELAGNIVGKTVIPAGAVTFERPIDIDFGLPVHCAKVQQNLLASPARRDGEGTAVPHVFDAVLHLA